MLVSGKGTRFILANTEQLHSKIHEMSNRIRLLEDALGKLHKTHEVFLRKVSHLGYPTAGSHHRNGYLEADDEEEGEGVPPHPLLLPELMTVKSSMELYTNTGTPGNGHTPGSRKQEGGQSHGHGHSEKDHVGDPGHSSTRPGTSYSMDVDLPFQKQRGSSEEDAMVLEDYSPGMVCSISTFSDSVATGPASLFIY